MFEFGSSNSLPDDAWDCPVFVDSDQGGHDPLWRGSRKSTGRIVQKERGYKSLQDLGFLWIRVIPWVMSIFMGARTRQEIKEDIWIHIVA